ncbi:GAF sensor signal transduction histidine kinase [Moorena producens 3L]|uniref:Circadian input-output histidine kinase CikA n=2 Tax=Coleofasciculaceae TaxID=1892251 RepID=F4XJM2_9CYAN|nr:GAF sensor signal transduction histidine kinase [Moorena producens 3L]
MPLARGLGLVGCIYLLKRELRLPVLLVVSRFLLMAAPVNFQCFQTGYINRQSASAQGDSNFLQGLGCELVYTQEASGKCLSFYWQAAEQYGLSLTQVVGLPLEDAFCPTEAEAYQERLQRILSKRSPERCVQSFCYQDRSFAFELVISPILPADGEATTVLVMGRFLPESSILEWRESPTNLSVDPHQQLLTKISRQIRRTLDLDTIWQQTAQSLGEALQVSRCLVCYYKPDARVTKVQAEYCQKPLRSMAKQLLPLDSEPYLEQALTSQEPLLVEHILPGEWEQLSVLVVSTSYKDEPNGLICLQQCGDRRQWSAAEIKLVGELAEQVGTAIAHGTLYKELEIASERAEEASRHKSDFLANTSHELRTPLNGMIGFLKLVLDGMADDPQEQRDFIQEAYNSALHLLNIINDILDIAKIEAGKMELELAPVELDSLFRKVEDFTINQAQLKNLSLRIEMPDVYDGIVMYGNYQRLLQVMLNLVGNAIKFTDEGGVTVSAEVIRKKITFKGTEFPGLVKVRVADTGIGVSLDQQDRLFQTFTQVDGSRTRQYGGTGLGLVISQKLIETMGGVVNFFSMGENLGSTVTFTVPLYQVPVMISNQATDID